MNRNKAVNNGNQPKMTSFFSKVTPKNEGKTEQKATHGPLQRTPGRLFASSGTSQKTTYNFGSPHVATYDASRRKAPVLSSTTQSRSLPPPAQPQIPVLPANATRVPAKPAMSMTDMHHDSKTLLLPGRTGQPHRLIREEQLSTPPSSSINSSSNSNNISNGYKRPMDATWHVDSQSHVGSLNLRSPFHKAPSISSTPVPPAKRTRRLPPAPAPRRTLPISPYKQSRPKPTGEFRPELSPDQARVLHMVLNDRKSIFFTGSAGTGKSVLLRGVLW